MEDLPQIINELWRNARKGAPMPEARFPTNTPVKILHPQLLPHCRTGVVVGSELVDGCRRYRVLAGGMEMLLDEGYLEVLEQAPDGEAISVPALQARIRELEAAIRASWAAPLSTPKEFKNSFEKTCQPPGQS